MEPLLLRAIAAPEFYSDEGCFIRELLNDERSPEMSMALARVAQGQTTEWHRLRGIAERYVIVQGEGVVELGETLKEAVRAGDAVRIPPDCPQRIRNTGSGDLLFYCLCTPRFDPARYERL